MQSPKCLCSGTSPGAHDDTGMQIRAGPLTLLLVVPRPRTKRATGNAAIGEKARHPRWAAKILHERRKPTGIQQLLRIWKKPVECRDSGGSPVVAPFLCGKMRGRGSSKPPAGRGFSGCYKNGTHFRSWSKMAASMRVANMPDRRYSTARRRNTEVARVITMSAMPAESSSRCGLRSAPHHIRRPENSGFAQSV